MKTILIISVAITFTAKIGLHIYLDKKNNRYSGPPPGNMHPISYFFFYTNKVDREYEVKKKQCNIFYVLFLILSTLTFFVKKFIV